MAENKAYQSPVGDLEWVTISGKGKPNISGTLQYLVSVVLEGNIAEVEKTKIDEYWADNKLKGIKVPKSLGYYKHVIPALDDDGEPILDEDGDPTKKETGKTVFVFKTGTTYKDGGAKKIPVFNAKGSEVNLGDKKVGNGSRGRVTGAMGIYSVRSDAGKVIDGGATLYLNGLQLSKFVEFTGGVNFGALGEDEGDFDGFDDGMGAIDETEGVSNTDASDKVKL